MSTAQDELIAYLATHPDRAADDSVPVWKVVQPFAVFTVLVGMCFAWNMLPRREYQADPALTAEIMAQRFVKQELLSPSTAKFPAADVRRAGDGWRVASYVDSQNGFGAMVRNYWVAELKEHAGGRWELVSLIWSKQ